MGFDPSIVEIDYTNHKGKRSIRLIRPMRLWFGSTAFHPIAGWHCESFDLQKMETRDFAMDNVHSWKRKEEVGKAQEDQ